MGIGAVWFAASPSNTQLLQRAREKPVSPRPDSALWGSPSVLAEMVEARAERGEDVKFLLGSSELTQSIEDSAYPVHFFEEHNFGFRVMCIGGAGYQSLWSAIMTGALDEEGVIPGRKIALLLGNCWFYEGGCTPEAFLNSFSDEALQECLMNPGLSSATKAGICRRVEELGVSSQTVEDLSSTTLIGEMNRFLRGLLPEKERRQQLADAIDNSCQRDSSSSALELEFDWAAFFDKVESQGKAACTNNDVGINDWYYSEYAERWFEENQKKDFESFSRWSDEEFGDLALFLNVCKDLNIEPLLIIEPAKGQYYDTTQYDQKSREVLYERMRGFLDEAGVDYLDLSYYDYDLYYLRDVMHMAWKGWAQIDRALVSFYSGESVLDEKSPSFPEYGDETGAEHIAEEAEEEMIEAEGAGKEVLNGGQ
ncbi:D-alanyl-lipoteichoic acid biosynthesis protein DltD [Parvibacter caecicola]|uniref:D-alanyl-lipoteichoic acid biosynthesis protein DltD n=1 Tax=Parvibacter caecicola TaxID=747645 RepID=UPI0021499FEF|nr:D-alanyl-lipoteichoic acid biosynthesis protein DltD [Parvibacter caecicola]MCR2041987.1 D-alanyl-lipoteichoic acid biosynthesis protein DltD [Parvibacter caecicola]